MKTIARPTETTNDILNILISDGVQSATLNKISVNRSNLTMLENQYILKVQDNTLFEIPRIIPSFITLTKKALINYYEYRILQKENGRMFYDKLILSAPDNICPYCTIKTVKTIDHFLPKSEYPCLSITPTNLIPCCRDCNTEKKISFPIDHDTQTFHPYFDVVDNEAWIIADLIATEPLSFHYRVKRLPHWDENKYKRALNHFNSYNIDELFFIEADRELRTRQKYLKGHLQRGKVELIKHLEETYESCSNSVGILDWQTIMYKSLKENEWFLEGCKGNNYFN